MSGIEWSDELSVGVPEIDEQHKKWVAIYNHMDEKLSGGDPEEIKALAGNALKEMVEYARYHFQSEEEYMMSVGYPGIDEHMEVHYDFTRQLEEYDEMVRDGKMVLNTTLMGIIKNWLVEHIMKTDKKYDPSRASS
jgi:hemerythrin-like metal-binding protein